MYEKKTRWEQFSQVFKEKNGFSYAFNVSFNSVAGILGYGFGECTARESDN